MIPDDTARALHRMRYGPPPKALLDALDQVEQDNADGLEQALDELERRFPACKSPTSACRGGRAECPTKDACQVSELRVEDRVWRFFSWALIVYCVLVLAILTWPWIPEWSMNQ